MQADLPARPMRPEGDAFRGAENPAQIRYRALVETAVWRRWGDELAVYEDRQAQTHLLAGGHAELFGLLAAQPAALTLADIAREFEGHEAVPLQQALSSEEMDSLRSLLHELVALGVVEARPA